MIRVQREDFDPGAELAAFAQGNGKVGGICMFLGLVRDAVSQGEGPDVLGMSLEHYPGMTERQLAAIETEARQRWPVEDVLIIHRFGRLAPTDRIVMVAAASAHREAAFQSCCFLMDWLKTRAPFWKTEHTAKGDFWVEARETDLQQAARWELEGNHSSEGC